MNLLHFSFQMSSSYQVGDVVLFGNRVGIIRCCGTLHDDHGDEIYAGIETIMTGNDMDYGNCDGTFDNVRYFDCKKNHGIFIKIKDIKCSIQFDNEQLLSALRLNVFEFQNDNSQRSLAWYYNRWNNKWDIVCKIEERKPGSIFCNVKDCNGKIFIANKRDLHNKAPIDKLTQIQSCDLIMNTLSNFFQNVDVDNESQNVNIMANDDPFNAVCYLFCLFFLACCLQQMLRFCFVFCFGWLGRIHQPWLQQIRADAKKEKRNEKSKKKRQESFFKEKEEKQDKSLNKINDEFEEEEKEKENKNKSEDNTLFEAFCSQELCWYYNKINEKWDIVYKHKKMDNNTSPNCWMVKDCNGKDYVLNNDDLYNIPPNDKISLKQMIQLTMKILSQSMKKYVCFLFSFFIRDSL